MQRGIVGQAAGADEANRRAQYDDDPHRDEGVACAEAEGPREALSSAWAAAPGWAALSKARTNRLNFSITKPKAMTAIPVRARQGRSARWRHGLNSRGSSRASRFGWRARGLWVRDHPLGKGAERAAGRCCDERRAAPTRNQMQITELLCWNGRAPTPLQAGPRRH